MLIVTYMVWITFYRGYKVYWFTGMFTPLLRSEQSLVLSGRVNEAEDTHWNGELFHSPWDELRAHAYVKWDHNEHVELID